MIRPNDPQNLQPPESLQYLVTYRYFTDYMQQQQISSDAPTSEESLNEAWKKYQMSYLRKQNHNFWNEQKEKEWFKERYEPSEVMENLRESSKLKGLEGAVESWLEAMESGLIDVGLDQCELIVVCLFLLVADFLFIFDSYDKRYTIVKS